MIKHKMNFVDATCPHCGAQMKEWWHRLTPGVVELLFRTIEVVKNKGVNIVEKNEVCKTNSECCNYNKLRYFGLIAYARDDNDDRIDGVFVLTRNAGAFLRGEIGMPYKVKTYRNELVEKSEEMVMVNSFRGKYPWFDSKYDFDFDIRDGKFINLPKVQTRLINF